MRPIDSSNAHLADSAFEIRAVKAGLSVFILALAAVFISLPLAIALFVPAYAVYKYRYYSERINVFATSALIIRHRRLELGLAATGVAMAGAVLVFQIPSLSGWVSGGVIRLPPIDFADPIRLVERPNRLLVWGAVLAPIVAMSYAASQLRIRLLFGLTSDSAAVRATAWESLARLPVYLLWVAVLSTRPLYLVWRPVVGFIEASVGLTAKTTGGFAILLGGSFNSVLVGGFLGSAVVIASFVVLQRWKYEDATIPELFGYTGFVSPTRRSHPANSALPITVFLLYTFLLFNVLGSPPLGDPRVALATVVSVLVGADVLGRTSMLVQSASERVADSIDAVVTGFVAGFLVLGLLGLFLGAGTSITETVLTYPLVALPLGVLGNRVAARYAITDVNQFVEGIESAGDAVDEAAVDRLFIYSEAADRTLRRVAIEGLAGVVERSAYRRDDALETFIRALESDDAAIYRAGLGGVSRALKNDRSGKTYGRVADAGGIELVVSSLDSDDESTRLRAIRAAARLFSVALETSTTDTPDLLAGDFWIERMTAEVDGNPEDEALASAVVDYFATVWETVVRSGREELRADDGAQSLLGGLLRLSQYADEGARSRAVEAVTGGPAAADVDRFSLAIDGLDNETDEVRLLAIHVIGSSIDRHAGLIDPHRLGEVLEDPSVEVRRIGARTIDTFVGSAPETGLEILDQLVFHLEDHADDPDQPEGDVLRALSKLDPDRLLDHPTVALVVARYVDTTSRQIAEPAADVLSSLVTQSPDVARTDEVGAAIETGLSHPSPEVRLSSLRAVVAIVEGSVDAARRFVGGLCTNLSTEGEHGGLAAACLAEIFEAHPEDGLDVLRELSTGLENPTPVDRDIAPFPIRGRRVSEVTVAMLVDVLPRDPGQGEVLVEPLLDIATTAEGSTLQGVFQLLSALSAEFPGACRAGVGTAAAVLEHDRLGIRRSAAEVLANVAARHPADVEPFIDRLVLTTDDNSQRVRAAALVGLTNVCVASPTAIEPDIHRVIGLLDDDSAAVREQAAQLIVVVADRQPGIVKPAAETADRLRRLQRDPAVDVETDRLQDASTAIQTGVPVGEAVESDRDEAIWSPESAEEMGASGDTRVFVPTGDHSDEGFGVESIASDSAEHVSGPIDEGMDEPGRNDHPSEDESAAETGTESDVGDLDTVVESGRGHSESAEPNGDADPQGGEERGVEPTGGTEDMTETQETVTQAEDLTADEGGGEIRNDSGEDVRELETVIDPGPDEEHIDDVADAETVLDPGRDDSPADVQGDVDEGPDIEPSDVAAGTVADPSDHDDARDAGRDPASSQTGSPGEDDVDVDDLETTIERPEGQREGEGEDSGTPEEVEEFETVIGSEGDAPGGDGSDNGRYDDDERTDVERLETTIDSGGTESEADDSDEGERADES